LQFLEATKACVNLLGVAYSFRDRVFGIEGGFAVNKRALWGSQAANKTVGAKFPHCYFAFTRPTCHTDSRHIPIDSHL
jgi:hypothetical protein